jgi:hypothetical protein
MTKFKKGDRVRVGQSFTLTEHVGFIGTVLENNTAPFIEFDQKIVEGHNAAGLGKEGFCFAYGEGLIEVMNIDKKLKEARSAAESAWSAAESAWSAAESATWSAAWSAEKKKQLKMIKDRL